MAELIAFTLLVAIIAIYEVLPRHRQLRVRYSLGNGFSLVLAGLSLVVVGGYAIGFIIQHTNQTDLTLYSSDSIVISVTYLEAGLSQLFAAIAIVAIFLWMFFRENVRVRSDESLLSILRELFNKKEYTTLTDVIEDNYVPLVRHPEKPTDPSQISLAEALTSDDDNEEGTVPDEISKALDRVDEQDSTIDRARDAISQKIQCAQYWIALFRYRLANTAEEANGYTERILLDDEFASEHPILNPDLGIKVIEDDDLDGFRREEITDQYLRTQLKTKNSLLYRDLKHSKGETRYRPKIDSENRLIHALLSDCSRAWELSVGKSIGRPALAIVREQADQEHDRYLTRDLSKSKYAGDYRYTDPVYVAITFLDLMVREAFFQRLTQHMWLREYYHLTTSICENYEVTEETEPEEEFPNDYSLFLSMMVRNMCNWLKAVQWMAVESDHDLTIDAGDDGVQYEEFIRLDSTNYDWGSNIPHVAATCLISCHRQILTTQEIPWEYKEKLSETIFTTCVELRDNEDESLPWRYSKLMIHCVEEELKPSRGGYAYREAFKRVYQSSVRDEITAKAMTGGDISGELDELLL